jgi:hypothetical protein
MRGAAWRRFEEGARAAKRQAVGGGCEAATRSAIAVTLSDVAVAHLGGGQRAAGSGPYPGLAIGGRGRVKVAGSATVGGTRMSTARSAASSRCAGPDRPWRPRMLSCGRGAATQLGEAFFEDSERGQTSAPPGPAPAPAAACASAASTGTGPGGCGSLPGAARGSIAGAAFASGSAARGADTSGDGVAASGAGAATPGPPAAA